MIPTTDTDVSPVRSAMAEDEDFKELLEMFVEGLNEKRGTMTAAFQQGDFESLRKLSHQLKGSGGGYGFPGVSERAAHLEEACKHSLGPDIIAERLQSFLTYIARVEV